MFGSMLDHVKPSAQEFRSLCVASLGQPQVVSSVCIVQTLVSGKLGFSLASCIRWQPKRTWRLSTLMPSCKSGIYETASGRLTRPKSDPDRP